MFSNAEREMGHRVLDSIVGASVAAAAEPDWRERRRGNLRAAILASAEDLIRKTGGTEFTMRALAEQAGVALATPYSLFGSKGAVLFALIEECVRAIDEQLDRQPVPDPIEQILAVSKISADHYAGDPVIYRPLLRFLGGTLEPEHHPALFLRAMRLWDSPIERGIKSGMLRSKVRPEILERQLLVNFTGVLQFWVQEELDGAGFRNHVLFGTALILTAHVRESLRPTLFQRIAQYEKMLPPALLKPGHSKPAKIAKRREKAHSA